MKKVVLFVLFFTVLFSLGKEVRAGDKSWYMHSPKYKKEAGEGNLWQFNNSTKLGGVLTTGNSKNFTIEAGNTFKVQKGVVSNVLDGGILFSRSNTTGAYTTTAKYFFVKDTLEYLFYKKWFLYTGAGWLSDELNGIEHNINGFIGVGNYILETDDHILKIGGGYNFSRELRLSAANQNIHSFAFGMKYIWNIHEHASVINQFDLLENLENKDDVRLKNVLSLKVKLFQNLAVSLSTEVRFDNVPVTGFQKWDTIQSVSMILDF